MGLRAVGARVTRGFRPSKTEGPYHPLAIQSFGEISETIFFIYSGVTLGVVTKSHTRTE